jgi:hypothetical protein
MALIKLGPFQEYNIFNPVNCEIPELTKHKIDKIIDTLEITMSQQQRKRLLDAVIAYHVNNEKDTFSIIFSEVSEGLKDSQKASLEQSIINLEVNF